MICNKHVSSGELDYKMVETFDETQLIRFTFRA
jgi:hypothetical protein